MDLSCPSCGTAHAIPDAALTASPAGLALRCTCGTAFTGLPSGVTFATPTPPATPSTGARPGSTANPGAQANPGAHATPGPPASPFLSVGPGAAPPHTTPGHGTPGQGSGTGGSHSVSGTPDSGSGTPGDTPPAGTGGQRPLLAPGALLANQFRVERLLGRGGTADVYLVRDALTDEPTALKAIATFGRAEDAARTLAAEHRAVRRVADLRHVLRPDRVLRAEHANMDWVLLPMEPAAMSLREWLHLSGEVLGGAGAPRLVERLGPALALLRQACLGAGALHAAGLAHLDLKPENLLLFPTGAEAGERLGRCLAADPEARAEARRAEVEADLEAARRDGGAGAADNGVLGASAGSEAVAARWTVRVADLGLARALRGAVGSSSHGGGLNAAVVRDGVGTPLYMAPEQVLAARATEVGPAADVYALGVVLFEAADGAPPFDGTAEQVRRKHRELQPPAIGPAVPEALRSLVGRCLAKDRRERPATGSELVEEVEGILTPGPDPAEQSAFAEAEGALAEAERAEEKAQREEEARRQEEEARKQEEAQREEEEARRQEEARKQVRVVMPKMGENVMEGTVLTWAKTVGDEVKLDETLLEISTDKVDSEVPSPATGVLAKILVIEGETVPAGETVAIINRREEDRKRDEARRQEEARIAVLRKAEPGEDDTLGWTFRAEDWNRMGHEAEARRCMRNAENVTAGNVYSWIECAKSWNRMGHEAEARRCMYSAENVETIYSWGWQVCARTWHFFGYEDEARRCEQKADLV